MNPFKKLCNWITGKDSQLGYITPYDDPYVLLIKNNADVKRNVKLFGWNDYMGSDNFGSDPDIEIINLQGGTYARLLNQSMSYGFNIGRWRIQSSNKSNLLKTMHILEFDANGKFYGEHLYSIIQGFVSTTVGYYRYTKGKKHKWQRFCGIRNGTKE